MAQKKQVLVVFGATGNQGGSVAHHVLVDPELSQRYSIRAITRDITNPKAIALQEQGATVVQADLEDPSSLPAALKDAVFVFALTNTHYGPTPTRTIETTQAKALCNAAIEAGAQYIIWSTLPSPLVLSNGRLTHASHFDVKFEIEQHIRSLPIKSAFFAPGSFMQNFLAAWNMKPHVSSSGDGTFVVENFCKEETKVPLIDITDTGKWVAAILAEPEKYEGKTFAGATKLYSFKEMCEIMSRVSGKTVRYQQVSDEAFKNSFPEGARDMLFEMWVLIRDYGYFGEGMDGKIEWANERARSELTDFETCLRREGFELE